MPRHSLAPALAWASKPSFRPLSPLRAHAAPSIPQALPRALEAAATLVGRQAEDTAAAHQARRIAASLTDLKHRPTAVGQVAMPGSLIAARPSAVGSETYRSGGSDIYRIETYRAPSERSDPRPTDTRTDRGLSRATLIPWAQAARLIEAEAAARTKVMEGCQVCPVPQQRQSFVVQSHLVAKSGKFISNAYTKLHKSRTT